MILINSAQFVVSDLQAEFGKIPPAFLPFGNERLFELQHKVISKTFPGERVYLSLPDEFTVPEYDLRLIQDQRIEILRHPIRLTLGQSVLKSLEDIGNIDDVFRVLHGDTLILDLPLVEDAISIAQPTSQQDWFYDEKNKDMAWAGYFSFSNQELLKAKLKNNPDFESSVSEYSRDTGCSRVLCNSWFDFGHVSTFYRARADKLINREFNKITHSAGVLKKTGPEKKIKAEINWYEKVPWEIKSLSPQYFVDASQLESNSYLMEYLPIPSLGEIFVFGNNSAKFWKNIFELAENYLVSCEKLMRSEEREKENQTSLVQYSTELGAHISTRLDLFEKKSTYFNRRIPIGVNGQIPYSIEFIVEECLSHISNSPRRLGFLHGDFCLGNVLFEVRSNKLRLIDPRGLNFRGDESLYGDIRYDLAKLSHSFLGFYDYIIAGRYDFADYSDSSALNFSLNIFVEESKLAIADEFFTHFIKGSSDQQVCISYMILLFITMAPLHEEHAIRQKALLSNAVSLFHRYVRSEF